jgi:hypothetical protein
MSTSSSDWESRGLGDGHLVEAGDAAREPLNELVELIVWQYPVDVAVGGRKIGRKVVTPKEDLERTSPPDEPGEASRRGGARYSTDANLELPENGLLTGEPDVRGQDKLAARASGSSMNG